MVKRAAEYLTTRELAELLRIKERKVYDLVAAGEVPCSRATGKLLFPRGAVEAWIASKSSGPGPAPDRQRANVILGSHDPLLEWALRESRSGLAAYFDGSFDGLERFQRGEGIASGLHLYDAIADAWNVPQVRERFSDQPVVLVEFARRERGLIVPPGNECGIHGIGDLAGRRVVPRQPAAGSQALLEQLLEREGVDPGAIEFTALARTETDAAVEILDGKAEAAFGLEGLARRYRLDFVPIVRERFDLLVDRRAWFEPELQTLLRFLRDRRFIDKAAELGGYDVADCTRVWFNGA